MELFLKLDISCINLEGLRILGSPYDYSKYYYENGADEIFYLDNVATLYGTNNLLKFIKDTAKHIYTVNSRWGHQVNKRY